MVSDPTTAPILFDRALLARRLARTRREGAVTFLHELLTDPDLLGKLTAKKRNFKTAWGVDIGQSGVKAVQLGDG